MRYRIIFITLIICVFFSGFSGSSQELNELDATFRKDLKKLLQYPGSEKRMDQLSVSYESVTRGEEELITSLRATGQPDIWYDIYRIQERIDLRQKEMLSLPDATLKKINFKYRDFGDEILENKHKAEAYLYAHATKLLGSADPGHARQAYHDLVQLAGLSKEYKNLDVLIRQAILKGATNIQYELYNKTGKVLNNKIVDQLSVAVYAYRDTRLKIADTIPVDNTLPVIIRIYLTELKVSPDRTKQLNYAEERDIYQDGVVVDTIRCNIDQFRQVKGAVLSGRIDIYDDALKTVINTVPFTAESMFVHSYATLKGNPDAAGEETRALLRQKEVQFPSNESIVMDAVEEFTKQSIKILLPQQQ